LARTAETFSTRTSPSSIGLVTRRARLGGQKHGAIVLAKGVELRVQFRVVPVGLADGCLEVVHRGVRSRFSFVRRIAEHESIGCGWLVPFPVREFVELSRGGSVVYGSVMFATRVESPGFEGDLAVSIAPA
jgi:hypothetical protein